MHSNKVKVCVSESLVDKQKVVFIVLTETTNPSCINKLSLLWLKLRGKTTTNLNAAIIISSFNASRAVRFDCSVS